MIPPAAGLRERLAFVAANELRCGLDGGAVLRTQIAKEGRGEVGAPTPLDSSQTVAGERTADLIGPLVWRLALNRR